MKEFMKRGFISAWGGPVVLAIVFLIIGKGDISLANAAKGVLTITVLAFVAGGITAIYTTDRLPLITALLIHGAVLYGAYLSVYLLNGWLKNDSRAIWIFTLCFLVGYALIWLAIYFITKRKAAAMTKALKIDTPNA